ncbi:hypothetical protein VTP01DRAFT_8310 [Rhizomucor pusillus]|uniref:uncharacterized protein n=1 Tax=Rhizomucor pusillus TaxID=4840 RepID=UPI003742D9B2
MEKQQVNTEEHYPLQMKAALNIDSLLHLKKQNMARNFALHLTADELGDLTKTAPAGVSVEPVNDDLFHWKDYPFKPPVVNFATKIYHPNIDDDGSICVDMLKADTWKPATKMSQVLEAIMTLLLQPNPDDALVGSIAEVYNTNRAKFEKTAKEYVKKYAQP